MKMKNTMKNFVAAILVMVLFSVSALGLAESSKGYTLDELKAMTGEELLALATTKGGSVQAKKALEVGDEEIGLYVIDKGTEGVGNGRRIFVDLLNTDDKLVARQSSAKWSSCVDTNGYVTAWCSAKTSNGTIKSAEKCSIRFFREADGKVFVIVKGNPVGDSAASGTKTEPTPEATPTPGATPAPHYRGNDDIREQQEQTAQPTPQPQQAKESQPAPRFRGNGK